MNHVGPVETWATIAAVAATAVVGDVLTAGAIRAVVSSPMFLLGVLSMALSFFTLLFTVSNVDVSLAAPASASLTFLGNAFAAKLFLKENVDRRRWLAALFVVAGVFLLAK
jgi:drug/metabolite transporter (DMT)-like permease